MFTGIINYYDEIKFSGEKIILKNKFGNIDIGESIALNGVCLTVEEKKEEFLIFSAGYATEKLTNIYKSKTVNAERALSAGDKLGGHYVYGHVDEMTVFLEKTKEKNSYRIKFKMPKEAYYIFKRCSIAINGISLTVEDFSLDTFSVQVIPHTFENTNIKFLRYGDYVNIEYDYLLKFQRRYYEYIKNKRWISKR